MSIRTAGNTHPNVSQDIYRLFGLRFAIGVFHDGSVASYLSKPDIAGNGLEYLFDTTRDIRNAAPVNATSAADDTCFLSIQSSSGDYHRMGLYSSTSSDCPPRNPNLIVPGEVTLSVNQGTDTILHVYSTPL